MVAAVAADGLAVVAATPVGWLSMAEAVVVVTGDAREVRQQ